MNMFPYTITTKGISIFIHGQPKIFSTSHTLYAPLLAAIDAGDVAEVEKLVNVKNNTAVISQGRVQILDNSVTLDGKEVKGALVDRILEMSIRGSKAISGYIKFLEKLYNNPSRTAVDELYLFIEACNLPVTPEGNFLAYKKVRADYLDIYSGKIDNSVGASPSMLRNEVDDNRNNTCSAGYHFCSYSYLPHYGGTVGNRVMVVEVDPANVVSIPSDYNNAKGRTWTYKVVGEIENWVDTTITPYFTDEYSEHDENGDSEFEDNYDGGDNFDIEHVDGGCTDDCCNGDSCCGDDTSTDTETTTVTPTKGKYGRKLTFEQADKAYSMYHDYGWNLTEIGKKLGVSRKTIARIVNGESYKT
jgi:hypothetical protein